MPRYKPYDYDQLLMVPVSLEAQLAPGTLEYAIHHLIEERVDTSGFDEKYRNAEYEGHVWTLDKLSLRRAGARSGS
jgi:hypothetical protein